MIARLTGTLAETSADGAVIDVGGVGYQVLASARTLDALGPIGGEVLILTKAAYRTIRGLREVLTTDALVDGVHFDQAFVPPRAIGHRALAVNLSDLAAMAADDSIASPAS